MRASPIIHGIDVTPPPEIIAKSKKKGGKLLVLPEVAAKALEIGRDPRCTIEVFTSVVSRDVKLAADVLKIANSVLYSPRTPIINLHRAVVRLGFRECQNLILSSSLASMMNKVAMEQEWLRTVLWWHSLSTGLLATYINRSFQIGFQGEEFTAGIIHDIGRTLFAVICSEEFAEIDALNFEEPPEILQHEMDVIGTDHCRFGAWFAVQNDLPNPIPEVILRHHNPSAATGEGRKLTALIAVADDMANYLQRNGTADGYDSKLNPGLPILSGFVPPPFESHFHEIAVSLMQEAQRDAKTMLEL
jgi:HD-like signal output (HDOD) protein